MRFQLRILTTKIELEFNSMFDALSTYRQLQAVGVYDSALCLYELDSNYEWSELDVASIFDGFRKLLEVKA